MEVDGGAEARNGWLKVGGRPEGATTPSQIHVTFDEVKLRDDMSSSHPLEMLESLLSRLYSRELLL